VTDLIATLKVNIEDLKPPQMEEEMEDNNPKGIQSD
jgi:hypothetical protein